MNTTNKGKKPKKIDMNAPLEPQLARIKREQEAKGREVDAGKEIYQAKINHILKDWFTSTVFPISIRKDWLCPALCHVSDLSLRVTFDAFKKVADKTLNAIELVELTYEETDIALQAISSMNANQLGLSLYDYINFKVKLVEIAHEFEKSFNENKERILKENPYEEKAFPDNLDDTEAEYPVLNTVGEA